jgi:hypothetical protein
VPIAITGETENMQIDKLLDRGRGLNRRLIVIKMTDAWKENSEVLDNALDKLQSHHGHILGYVKSLKEEDKKEITDLMKGIQARLHFGDSSFKDLKKHLALSLAVYFHFYEKYIGMDAVDIAEKVNAVVDFIAKQINDNQATRIGENTDYIGEIINFIAKVEEAISNRKVLKNKTYPSLCSDIGFITSDRVKKVILKFFFREYQSKKIFSPGVLLGDFPFLPEKERFNRIKEDKKRLENFSDEEIYIWLEILKLKHHEDVVNMIVESIRDKRLEKLLGQEEVSVGF